MRGLTDTADQGRRARAARLPVLLPEGGVGHPRRAARALAPHARVVTIDTGVLFPETLQTWRAFEERFGVHVDVEDAPTGPAVDGAAALLRRGARSRRSSARWPAPTRGSPASAASRPPRAPTRSSSSSTTSARCGSTTRSPTGPSSDLWQRIHERDLPYHPLHDQGYASIGCAPCTQPGSGREGRWAGTDKIECGLHVA